MIDNNAQDLNFLMNNVPTTSEDLIVSEDFLEQIERASMDDTETTKTKIKEARRDRMRTVTHYICDQCDQPILTPDNGFIVHGNIYVADTSRQGGLIGNNFPDEGSAEDVKKSVFCKKCFLQALNLKEPKFYETNKVYPQKNYYRRDNHH